MVIVFLTQVGGGRVKDQGVNTLPETKIKTKRIKEVMLTGKGFLCLNYRTRP